jgi:uncharacterized membrane protein
MRNRIVGAIVIGISVLMAFIIYSFNFAMTNIINDSCSHGPSCPMWGTLGFQTNLSIGITAFVFIIGIYLTFFGEEERIVVRLKRIHEQIETKPPSRKNFKDVLGKLDPDEKMVFEKVIDNNGNVLQSELVSGLGMSKVRITRVLDRLEGRNLIERRRRGMSNSVIIRR